MPEWKLTLSRYNQGVRTHAINYDFYDWDSMVYYAKGALEKLIREFDRYSFYPKGRPVRMRENFYAIYDPKPLYGRGVDDMLAEYHYEGPKIRKKKKIESTEIEL